MPTPEELRNRTKAFALRVIRLYGALPLSAEAQVMGKQWLRCGTSVAANYRAACRARSRAEFAARLGVVVEEADEGMLWLELLIESGVVPHDRLEPLQSEAKELTLCSLHRSTQLAGVVNSSERLEKLPITNY